MVERAEKEVKNSCKTVIVSRDIIVLERSATARIQLNPDNNGRIDSDIETFVSARVEKLMRMRLPGYDSDLRQKVKRTLLDKAENTFLWIGFATEELLQKRSRIEIEHALQTLPRGLPKIYDRMLERIEERHLDVVAHILKWVALAPLPLKTDQLEYAMHSETQGGRIEYYVEHSRLFLEIQRDQDIQLVHQSARDYLMDNNRAGPVKLQKLIIHAQQAHFELARSCFDILFEDYKIQADNRARGAPFLILSPFSQHGALHASAASKFAAKVVEHPSNFFGIANLNNSAFIEYYYKRFCPLYGFGFMPSDVEPKAASRLLQYFTLFAITAGPH